jgi:hypothetical protein
MVILLLLEDKYLTNNLTVRSVDLYMNDACLIFPINAQKTLYVPFSSVFRRLLDFALRSAFFSAFFGAFFVFVIQVVEERSVPSPIDRWNVS